jgi:3-oxoacyl-[acyl-carrier protein] reductase
MTGMNAITELQDRVAVVTGAGRNIGRAIALELAAAGAAVVVNARSNAAEADAVAREIGSRGGRAAVALGDVTDRGAVERMAALAAERFGGIDILVNNAALRRESKLESMTFEEWRQITGCILDGAFHCVQACLPHIRRSRQGAIVNVGGLSAHAGSKDRLHVVTAKSGLVGFTRGLAHDLAEHGVTVNCLAPGFIDTARRGGGPAPAHHATSTILAGRLGAVQEIAATVRFLCGPSARYITGQTVHVNGGAYLG